VSQPKTKRNRRPLNAAQQAQPQLLLPQFDSADGATVLIGVEPASFVFSGIPQVALYDATPAAPIYPISASFDPGNNGLTLTYSRTLTALDRMVYPAWEPSLRTATGGWVSPAIMPVDV
jgi:hypothetical protein